jgi:septal ring factor EnvC (AmiA/AmiB activator)
MDATEWTAIGTLVIGVITGLGVPFFVRQRRLTQSADSNQIVSWQSITKAIQDERDKLKSELDLVEEEHRSKMRTMQADYDAQLATANNRIRELESDVNRMATQIYRLQNMGPPSYPPSPRNPSSGG